MTELQQRIIALKKEKNALILAHYYQTTDIREIADHVCDSFEMARLAHSAKQDLLIICGVHFMAESAKILNADKTVLIPSPDAGCPMADMIAPEDVVALRETYPDAAVVCYVNSSAAVKAVSDICCTSSSAERVVRSLAEKRIIFIPDRNLGAYIASKVTDKDFIFHEGCCPVHDRIGVDDVFAAKKSHPHAKLLVHPECRPEVLRQADFIGSTAEIISYAMAACELESNSGAELTSGAEFASGAEFIIGTELGVTEHLKKLSPDKRFYPLTDDFLCKDMKKTRLSDVLNSLETGRYEIVLGAEEISAAKRSLERMVAV